MPRQAREKSRTGIYHIVLKGIDDRDIFMDDQDRRKFLEQLWRAKNKDKFEILVYCLMDNHIHLLIKENEDIGKSIQRMASGYAIWHNEKYGRRGHLFYNRYSSEIIESESYLLSVARYILQNPVKAGVVNRAADYEWSSYQSYLRAFNRDDCSSDSKQMMDYFQTPKDFVTYMDEQKTDKCLDHTYSIRYTDDEIRKIVDEKFPQSDSVKPFSKNDRNIRIRQIQGYTNASIRQLGRVLGISKKVIENAVRQENTAKIS